VNQAPAAALRAQRSKDTLQSDQYSGRISTEDDKGTGDGPVSSDKWNESPPRRPQRPESYIIDVVTIVLPFGRVPLF
jgi:hypothetical protein